MIAFIFIYTITFGQQNDFQQLINEADSFFNNQEYFEAYKRYHAISLLTLSNDERETLSAKIIQTRKSIASIVHDLHKEIDYLDSLQRNYELRCLQYEITKLKMEWRSLSYYNNENPEEFDPEEHIDSLDLSGYGLGELPTEVFNLKSLTYLDLSGNRLDMTKIEGKLKEKLPHLKYNLKGYFKSENNKLKSYKKEINDRKNSLKRLTYNQRIDTSEFPEAHYAFEMVRDTNYIDALIYYDILKKVDKSIEKDLIPLENLVIEIIEINIDKLKNTKTTAQKTRKETKLIVLNRAIRLIDPYCIKDVDTFGETDFEGFEILSFKDFQINEISNEVKKFKNLKQINLIGNSDLNWEDVFPILPPKTWVFISIEDLLNIPDQYRGRIGGFRHSDYHNAKLQNELIWSNLFHIEINNINNLDDDLLNEVIDVDNIEQLTIKYCNLTEIPEKITQCKNLKTLDLSGNNIKVLSDNFSELKQLEELNLTGNDFVEFPAAVTKLENLRKLKIKGNILTNLPSEISNLKSLEVVDISGNKLREVIVELGKIKGLKYLDLNTNKLKTIPANISELKELTTLILRNNYLSEFPQSICKLTNLETLDIGNNEISSVPKEIGKLQNLKELDMKNCSITDLPDEFENLKNLTYLDLSSNGLTSSHVFSSSERPNIFIIWKLANLEKLILEANEIKDIPKDEIMEMGKLRHLNLKNNPIKDEYLEELGEISRSNNIVIKF